MNETVEKLSQSTGVSVGVVSKVLRDLATLAYQSAADGFVLPGFGEFEVVEEEGREGINPFTGEPTLFKGKTVVEFRLNPSARDAFLAGARGESTRDVTAEGEAPPELPEVRLTLDEGDLQRAGLTRVFEPREATKLGGEPDWIQNDEAPECVGCGRPMQFYAQIDSAFAEEFYIGDVGRLYVFRCTDCWHAQALMQCS